MYTLQNIYQENYNSKNLGKILIEGIKNGCIINKNFYFGCLVNYGYFENNENDFIDIYFSLKERGFQIPEYITFNLIGNMYEKALNILKNDGYNMHYIDSEGENAFFKLVKSNDRFYEEYEIETFFNYAFSLGINPNLINHNQENLLHIFIRSGRPIYYLYQLLKFDLDINLQNLQGLSPLHTASLLSSDDKVLEILIQHGADTKLKTNSTIFEDDDCYEEIDNDDAFILRMKYLDGIGGELSQGTEEYDRLHDKYIKMFKV